MKKTLRSLAVCAAVAATALTGVAGANAVAPTPRIVGGSQAPQTDWAVQLVFNQGSGSYGCTGEAIAPQWVLTAQHCIDGSTNMKVYFSNSTANRGPAIAGDQLIASPNGDVALVHLASAKNLSSYPTVANSYTANSGDSGVIMGYGLRANKARPDGLYQATVSVLGSSTDAYNGTAVHVKGQSGAANHGDSGGPLLINNQIVGVCSTGDDIDPGANTHAGSNYANLTKSRSWIKQKTGV